jgi:tryptophan synthase alpha subunit
MSEFKVQKQQVAASLILSTGAIRHGQFFVVTSLTHGGPERVGDLLNSAPGFFPFQHDNGTTGQYNRNHLVMVMLPAGIAEEESEPGFAVSLRRDVSMMLSTGTTIDGTVLVSGPVGQERLSDYARASKQFWYVLTLRGTVIVNSEHIVELIEKGTE